VVVFSETCARARFPERRVEHAETGLQQVAGTAGFGMPPLTMESQSLVARRHSSTNEKGPRIAPQALFYLFGQRVAAKPRRRTGFARRPALGCSGFSVR
jgi:hypothetical protein